MKIEIDIPEGYEVDTENSTKECIKLKKIENKLPKTWEEFCDTCLVRKDEYWVSDSSNIGTINLIRNRDNVNDKNLLPNKELAEAMLALCQLIQLRDCYNDGWKPDWTDNRNKYTIITFKNKPISDYTWLYNRILAFKTQELRDQFLENFRDLIEIAKPLL